jgi:phosphatidylinositol kinase/protein kinase (PI-3  family)
MLLFLQPLKAPKSGPKDYDENDLEYLKKKKEEVGRGILQWCLYTCRLLDPICSRFPYAAVECAVT